MTTDYAYSTDDPAAVAAFRETRDAITTFAARLKTDCAALGGNDGAYVRRGIWGSPDEITSLKPDGSGNIPDGWRIVREELEPRRGKPGEGARRWLADHQPPDVRQVMMSHGLPRHSVVADGGGFRHFAPVLFEHEGTLWACYRGRPGDGFLSDGEECTWQPRRLSEFYAAREGAEAIQLAESVA